MVYLALFGIVYKSYLKGRSKLSIIFERLDRQGLTCIDYRSDFHFSIFFIWIKRNLSIITRDYDSLIVQFESSLMIKTVINESLFDVSERKVHF